MKPKFLFKLVVVGTAFFAFLLAVANSSLPVSAQEPDVSSQAVLSTSFIYQGQLADANGPVTNTCDFTFALFDAATAGNQVGSTVTANGTSVTNGAFFATLDFGATAFTGDRRFLEVTVDCGNGATTLNPRQELTAVPYALGLRPGATIVGTGAALTGETTGTTNARGLVGLATNASGNTEGVRGETHSNQSGAIGVYGLAIDAAATGTGVKGQNNGTTGYGVWGQGGNNATGVLGQSNSTNAYGVWALNTGTGFGLRAEGGIEVLGGTSDSVDLSGTGTVLSVSTTGSGSRAISGSASGATNPAGVYGTSNSTGGRGVFGEATSATGSTAGVRGEVASVDSGATGVFGLVSNASGTGAGVKGQNNGTTGYGVWGQGGANAVGVLGQTGSTTNYGVWALNTGTGVALRAEGSGGGSLIEGWDTSGTPNRRFVVNSNGTVVADGAYSSAGADFAEMLPATDGLEPGDVLVIGLDGELTLSSEAYQSTVAGVYSTKPGFLGGGNDNLTGKVPLAVVGIVPVKVSVENGAIQPGDLLVASDTPGHAMRADGDAPNGTVIGKALSALDADTGVIQMLVILQ